MKIKVIIVAILLTSVLSVGIVNADKPDIFFLPVITISPYTLILSAPNQCVSVHTNIPCKLVDTGTLMLSGIPPYLVKTDARGNVVVKVHGDAVKEIVELGPFTLKLTGEMIGGTPFSANDTIMVKE